MKTTFCRICVASLCALTFQSIFAQDQTVNGNLFISNNLDVNGNAFSFGENGSNPAVILSYVGGASASVELSGTASATNWFWRQGTSIPQMQLSGQNVLSLFSPGSSLIGISLDPAGAAQFGGGLLKLSSFNSGSATPLAYPAESAARIYYYNLNSAAGATRYFDFVASAQSGGSVDSRIRFLTSDNSGVPTPKMIINELGDVGIGTNAPGAKLEVNGDLKISGALITPNGSSNLGQGNTVTGASAVALGLSNLASEESATAIGVGNSAGGYGSIAIGYFNFSDGLESVALGAYNNAWGEGAVALGVGNSAGLWSLATGSGSLADNASLAMGIMTHAQAGSFSGGEGSEAYNQSLAFGGYAHAIGIVSLAIGADNYARGYLSKSLGDAVEANASHVTVIGRRNVPQGQPNIWVPTDDLFVVGNGYWDDDIGESIGSNAFVVHKDGDTRVAGDLDVRGVVRMKPAGDLSMGQFVSGPNPSNTADGLNAGLRYPGE